MANFEKFQNALKKAEEKRNQELNEDIRTVRSMIEKFLKLAFENTAHETRVNYAGMDML